MKDYKDNDGNGVHVVQITLQSEEYKGVITTEVGGNARGMNLISYIGFDCEMYESDENDCDLKYDEDSETYRATLHDEDGSELDVEGDAEDFNNMIVAIEIIDYIPD